MTEELAQLEILSELEPAAEQNLNGHLSMAKEWHPHDYVPWDLGRNFAAMGGQDWDPSQSALGEVARVAMITNLLTEDNLPPTTAKSPRTSPRTAPGAPGSAAGPPKRGRTGSGAATAR